MRRRVGRRLLVGAVLLVGLLQVSSAEAGAWQRYRAKKWLALSWVLSPFFGPIAPIVGTLGFAVYNAPEVGYDVGRGLGTAGHATASGFRKIGTGIRNVGRA